MEYTDYELLPKKRYLNELNNYCKVAEMFPCTIYRCLYQDVFEEEKYIAIHNIFRTLLTAESKESIERQIERRNKENRW